MTSIYFTEIRGITFSPFFYSKNKKYWKKCNFSVFFSSVKKKTETRGGKNTTRSHHSRFSEEKLTKKKNQIFEKIL